MEFLEEDIRPRFLFHSRASTHESQQQQPQKLNKRLIFLCASLAILLLVFSIFFTQSETLKSLLLWFSLSVFLGPFAPISITGGDICVGQGKLLEEPSSDLDPLAHLDESKKKLPYRRQKTRKPDDLAPPPPITVSNSSGSDHNSKELERKSGDLVGNGDGSGGFQEKEWTDQDFDLLKKQMLKHPVGKSKRWELISETFRGRHRIDSVIKMGKSMGERRPSGGDSFSHFLNQRKPLDRRLEASHDEEVLGDGQVGEKQSSWSSGEDIALLNALKAFPKEVSMRWEKIAAAVPGRSKAACMKRVSQLKRDFRCSKASLDS